MGLLYGTLSGGASPEAIYLLKSVHQLERVTALAYRFDGYGNPSSQVGPDVTSSKFAGAHGYESDAPLGLQLLGHR